MRLTLLTPRILVRASALSVCVAEDAAAEQQDGAGNES